AGDRWHRYSTHAHLPQGGDGPDYLCDYRGSHQFLWLIQHRSQRDEFLADRAWDKRAGYHGRGYESWLGTGFAGLLVHRSGVARWPGERDSLPVHRFPVLVVYRG